MAQLNLTKIVIITFLAVVLQSNSYATQSDLQGKLLKLVVEGDPKQIAEAFTDETINIPLNDNGDRALHLAVVYNPRIIPTLLRLGANPTLLNAQGHASIHVAALLRRMEALMLLLETTWQRDLENMEGHLITWNRFENQQNVDVNEADKFGFTALHLAVIQRNWFMVEYLLSRGGNINAQNMVGDTPVHLVGLLGYFRWVLDLERYNNVLGSITNIWGVSVGDIIKYARDYLKKLLIQISDGKMNLLVN